MVIGGRAVDDGTVRHVNWCTYCWAGVLGGRCWAGVAGLGGCCWAVLLGVLLLGGGEPLLGGRPSQTVFGRPPGRPRARCARGAGTWRYSRSNEWRAKEDDEDDEEVEVWKFLGVSEGSGSRKEKGAMHLRKAASACTRQTRNTIFFG